MGETEKNAVTNSEDYLGYSVYAQTLWARIQAALDKDLNRDPKEPLGDDPLVVGIFGEWGAGKSFLLKKVRQLAERQRDALIAAHKLDTGFTLTVPVFFQPWKYEHEQHLLVPLLLHIEAELSDCLKKAQSTGDKVAGVVHEAADRAKAHLPAVVDGFKNLLGAARTAYQLAEPASAGMLLPIAGWLAGQLKGVDKPGNPPSMGEFRWDADSGRSFYELHDILQAVTRPSEASVKNHLPNANIRSSFRINFVIFIDDLDRCLPEKAVETLELIKTIFNLESFAFVLALDEEVVERGIGHRYKDYALAGKKPEMPITGFEYLEKIVHLPFRLPPLTARQAMQFVRKHEALIQPDAQCRWFDAPVETKVDPEKGLRLRGMDGAQQLDPLPLVLSCFDHFVPRKLIRLVELMKQLTDVTETVGRRAIDRNYGGQLDPRVVIALVLLQLFAPELYRFLRRRPEAFSIFLSSFATKTVGSLGHHVSDADLCDWVVPPAAKRRAVLAQPNDHGLNGLMDRLSGAIASQWQSPRERANAQNIRLPLVRLLLEHRALYRNVFDPVKLFQVLAAELQHTGQNPTAVVLRPYLSLLTEKVERNADTPRAYRHRVHQLEAFFEDMVFDEAPVRANILARHDVPEDAFLSRQTVQGLVDLASKEFDPVKEVESDRQKLDTERANLLHALLQLDEAIADDDRALWKDMLELFQGSYETPPPGVGLDNPSASAHFWEIQSRWGFDNRFDMAAPGLPIQRWPINKEAEHQEPIKGFVRVDASQAFDIGSDVDNDNPQAKITLVHPFYMARYLTTVGQYKYFVDGGGYTDKHWWDEQGWAWMNMQWASETNEPALRQWLDSRTQEQRTQPMEWKKQLRSPSQPVWGINWFEARAYARWLTTQLRPHLKGDLKGLEACLPTEWQWERAARFVSDDHNETQYPGSADKSDWHRLANIADSGIGSPSVVGCFAPNMLGISDLHGNLWEWQDNLYTSQALHLGCERKPKVEQAIRPDGSGKAVPGADWLQTKEKWSESDRPALRGGAWNDAADNARASFRLGVQPDLWINYVGFRVVLSLTNLDSET